MRFASAGALLASALALPARAQTGELPAWVHPDPAAKTVLLDLAVTRPAGATSALISGEHDGGIQVIVPRGWTIKWHWINQDSTASHSLVVVAEREKLPQQGGQAVFTNAMTRGVLPGLPVGRTDDTSFEAEDGGWFWVICGVPGHAIAGEWIGLKVDPAASEVGVTRKQAGSLRALLQLAAYPPTRVPPVDFVLDALSRHQIVFLGDVHPIAEPKQILAEVITLQDPATAIDLLALEVAAEQQPFIDAYLRSMPEDTTLLMDNPRTLRSHWGASHEYLQIYRAVYRWNHANPGHTIHVAASDIRGWPIAPLTEMMAAGGFANRDEWMARSFTALAKAHPDWRILIFMGGYHGLQIGGGQVDVGRAQAKFDNWFCGYLKEGGIQVYTILTDAVQDQGHGATRVYDELATRRGENFGVTLDVATDSIRQPMYEVAMEGYKLSFWPDRFPLRLAVNAMIVLETSSPTTLIQQ